MKLRFLGASLLCSLAIAQADVDEQLREMGKRALTAVEQHLDVELGRPLTFRYATPQQLEAILVEELAPQFRVQFADEEEASRKGEAFAKSMASALLAKYAFASGDVLVVRENIARTAELLAEPGLDTPEVLQAALVHECVHVLADKRYQFSTKLRELASADELLAYNAVVEGHAQLIARAVCKKNGWSEAFELCTKLIGRAPDLGDEGSNMLARIQSVSTSWAYHDGERFVEAVQRAGGDAAIERAYRTPPTSPAMVFRPQWYLDPDSRPEVSFDIDGGFRAFEEAHGGDEWTPTHMTLNSAQIRAGLGLLPEADVDRFVEHMLDCRSLSLNWKNPPGKHFVAIAVFVTDTQSEALFSLAAEERLLRAKDEAMTKGPIKIVSASYEPIAMEAAHGLLCVKTVKVNRHEMPVTTLVLAEQTLVMEISFSNQEITKEEIVALGTDVLATMLRGTQQEAATPDKKD